MAFSLMLSNYSIFFTFNLPTKNTYNLIPSTLNLATNLYL
ncbi:hypothetical protein QMM_3331 [Clostridioides difficile DA00275]|nr:hypothetical protein QMM_3331 [Clostridioides difficile DA00275]EQI39756.1 hypothetical protein QOY_3215 [Clostridioides difficile Y231]EQI73456.1 hypothetical protein QQC_3835 [Clostridioides difficile Y358]